MRDTDRPEAPDEGAANRALSFEKFRRRKRTRAMRRMTILVVLLALFVAYVTGVFGASLAAAGEGLDALRISFLSEASYPLQTGISELYQLEELSGGFVALGAESCVVYSANGNRLRSIQPGYGRPAIAAGKTRFVIYNRSGKEMRVESRLRSLYTPTFSNGILLCAVADGGQLAVATEHPRFAAELTVYSPTMDTLLTWRILSAEGTPLRMAFAADSRRLAVATLTAENGQTVSKLFLLDTAGKSDEQLVAAVSGSVPLTLQWLSSSEVCVVYDDHVSVFSVSGGTEKYRYDYANETLTDASVTEKGTALLFGTGGNSKMVLLSAKLEVEFAGSVSQARHVTRTADAAYLLTDNAVEAFTLAGEYLWSISGSVKPQAVLDAKRLLLFTGNSVQLLQPPTPDAQPDESAPASDAEQSDVSPDSAPEDDSTSSPDSAPTT